MFSNGDEDKSEDCNSAVESTDIASSLNSAPESDPAGEQLDIAPTGNRLVFGGVFAVLASISCTVLSVDNNILYYYSFASVRSSATEFRLQIKSSGVPSSVDNLNLPRTLALKYPPFVASTCGEGAERMSLTSSNLCSSKPRGTVEPFITQGPLL